MAKYVDGFVTPVKKKNLQAYRRLAQMAGKIFREYGAIEFRECVGDDLNVKFGLPFSKLSKLKPGETVLFSWITYKSRAHRDRVNTQAMKDKRMMAMNPKTMPFDPKRMAYDGFKVFVEI